MIQPLITPFDTIESAQDFVSILGETVAEARQEIEVDLQCEMQAPPTRHCDALRIAVYNLEKLEAHLNHSRRILNDLRTLRRLLFAEHKTHRVKPLAASGIQPEAPPAIIAAIPAPKPVSYCDKSKRNVSQALSA
jgi:hypothetical protein